MKILDLALIVAVFAACVGAADAAPRAARGQAAAKFIEQPIRFASPDESAMLDGTLVLPAGEGPFPAAIFLSVAGPDDRDQTIGKHRGFRDLAARLAAAGVASLRFDDRGVGASTGNYFATSWSGFAADAAQVWDVLAAHPSIDRAGIGFLGMSQGAALAAMASGQRPDSAFVVLLSAPGLPGAGALRDQLDTMMRLNGVSGPLADQYRAAFDQYIGMVTEAGASHADQRRRLIAFLSGPGRGLIPRYAFMPKDEEAIADLLLGPWYQSNVRFDPVPVYGRLVVPVLAVGGGRDPIAPPARHLAAIRDLLVAAPAGDVTTIWFESGNHLLQESRTGLPSEYSLLEQGMSAEIMDLIANWIARRFAREF